MAKEFPHANVVGFDLVPSAATLTERLPENCHLELKDLNGGMVEWQDQVDVLHARSIDGGVDDFDAFLYNCARCLRPNGVLLLVTGSFVRSLVLFPERLSCGQTTHQYPLPLQQFYDELLVPLPAVEEGLPG